jgi:hypothetical protein
MQLLLVLAQVLRGGSWRAMEDWVGRYMESGSSYLFTVSDAMNQAIFSSAKIPSDSLKDAPQPDLDACSFQ